MKRKEEAARLRMGKEMKRILKILEVKKSSGNLKSGGKVTVAGELREGQRPVKLLVPVQQGTRFCLRCSKNPLTHAK